MSKIRKCKSCGNIVRSGCNFCTNCGAKYIETGKHCTNPECPQRDEPAAEVDHFCGCCGSQLVED